MGIGATMDGIAAEATLVRYLEGKLQEHTDGDGAVDQGLQAKLDAIKQQRHMIKLNFQKQYGIVPEDFDALAIQMNTVEGDEHLDKILKDSMEKAKAESKPILEMIIISRQNPLYIAQRFIYVLSCLVSSYTYVWFAAFAPPTQGTTPFYIMVAFELQFLLAILVTFFVEFEVEGQV